MRERVAADEDFSLETRPMVRSIEDFVAASSAGASSLRVYDERLHRVEKWLGESHKKPSVPLLKASKRDLIALKKRLRGMRSGPQLAVILRMFYRAAGRPNIAAFLGIKQRIKTLSPDDVLLPQDVNAMLQHTTSIRDRALIVALWNSGVRISEILSVNLGDVKIQKSPENGRVFYRIHFRSTKNDVPHDGHVTEGVDHLEAWLRVRLTMPDTGPENPDAPLLVSYQGRRMSKNGAEHMVRRTAARAGLTKKVYPHLFRHSRATHLLRIGVSEPMVKKLLGWKPSSTMLSRYAHLSTGDAYVALLKAQGYQVPEPTDYGKILEAEGQLEPVFAMAPPPGTRPVIASLEGVDIDALRAEIRDELWRVSVKDLADAVQKDLASRPAPAWTPGIQDVVGPLQDRIAQLEAKLREAK